MSFTPQLVIDRARVLLNDTRSPFRYSDDQMLGFFNDALQRMFSLRPDAFADRVLDDLVPGSAQQSVIGGSFLDIEYVSYDNEQTAVREVIWKDFTNAQREWVGGTPGVPSKFVKDKYNPSTYHVNPRPLADVGIMLLVAENPGVFLTLGAEVDSLIDEYVPALTDCVVFLASSIDDEHVASGRAKLFYDSFLNQLGASEQVLRRNSLGPLGTSQEMRNDPQ